MRVTVVGLGLIGGSMALGLAARHEVRGHDPDGATRRAATERGLAVADGLEGVLAADAIIVATPLAAIVPTLERLVPRAGAAVILEVGSLKGAVAAYARGARADARIVGLHPMAGSTASGFAAADPAMFGDRPFLVVPTERSDERSMAIAGEVARDLGGRVTVCSVQVHDEAIATVSALPLATAIALARVADAALPMRLDDVAGPGLRDATRLAATPPDLALALLAAPGLAAHIAALRSALADVEGALGDDLAMAALLGPARRPTP